MKQRLSHGVSKRLPTSAAPWDFFKNLPQSTPKILLESVRPSGGCEGYSIVAWDPFLLFRVVQGRVEVKRRGHHWENVRTMRPLQALRRIVRAHRVQPEESLPPFATGALGYVGYECKDYFERRLFSRTRKELSFPEMYFMLVDQAVIWDHAANETIYCRRVHSKKDSKVFDSWVGQCERRMLSLRAKSHQAQQNVAHSQVSGLDDSMTRSQFVDCVKRIQTHIQKGDIFQANLSHRISFPLAKGRLLDVYEALRVLNPSPFFGVVDALDFQIISGSPERLVKLERGQLQTRPIAGTRRRGTNAQEDDAMALELLLNEKERAEHVMLVDLERNDLGRVSEFGSVSVDELMGLENYSHVKHIVSNVRGRLRKGLDAFDAFEALFPGGTITGAPKIRSMQILNAVENVPRGPYTGSLGYFSFTGDMDFNILIRSLFCRKGKASLHVGAGIVADSDPEREYDETLYKAKAVLEAVFGKDRAERIFRERRFAGAVS